VEGSEFWPARRNLKEKLRRGAQAALRPP
jgi:hypothetical protein